MKQDNFINLTDSDMFYVEQSSKGLSQQNKNTPEILNSTELSGAPEIEHITLSSVASLEAQLITIHSDSNEPTTLYGYGKQDPIVLSSLNNLNLLANPFNILATTEVVHPTAATHDDNYSPQSTDQSEPSSISRPSMNRSTIERWETPHTTTDENTLYSDEEPSGIYLLPSSSSPPPPPRKLRQKMSSGIFLPKRRVSQHVCEACGQTLPTRRNIRGTSTDWNRLYE